MAFIGDTVRLKVKFKDFSGQAIDPTNITLTIYDSNEQQIEQFILDGTNKENVGVYFYDYQTPFWEGDLVFEFSGLYNNKSILCREKIKRYFVND